MNYVYDKKLTIQQFVMSYAKHFHPFTIYLSASQACQDKFEHWRKEKLLSGAKIKIGTFSCCTYESKNFYPRNYTNCS